MNHFSPISYPFTEKDRQDEYFYLIGNVIQCVEDMSVNEITVHTKLINKKSYELPYQDIQKLFHLDFDEHYLKTYGIFESANIEMFSKYIQSECRLWRR